MRGHTEDIARDLVDAYQPDVAVVDGICAKSRRREYVGRKALWQAILNKVQRMVKACDREDRQVIKTTRGHATGKNTLDSLDRLHVRLQRAARQVSRQRSHEKLRNVFMHEDKSRQARRAWGIVGWVGRCQGDGDSLGGLVDFGRNGGNAVVERVQRLSTREQRLIDDDAPWAARNSIVVKVSAQGDRERASDSR